MELRAPQTQRSPKLFGVSDTNTCQRHQTPPKPHRSRTRMLCAPLVLPLRKSTSPCQGSSSFSLSIWYSLWFLTLYLLSFIYLYKNHIIILRLSNATPFIIFGSFMNVYQILMLIGIFLLLGVFCFTLLLWFFSASRNTLSSK